VNHSRWSASGISLKEFEAGSGPSDGWLWLWQFHHCSDLLHGDVFREHPDRADLKTAVDHLKNLALGNVSQSIEVRRKDEIGQLGTSVKNLQENLLAKATAAAGIARGNLEVSIPVASSEDVLGQSLVEAVTALRGLVQEMVQLSRLAVDGKLSMRGNVEKFQGGYREIVEGVNGTLDAVIGPLKVAAEHMNRISKGEIPGRITETYRGDFNTIKKQSEHLHRRGERSGL